MMSDIGLILILIGLFFDLIGAIGLVRMPDLYSRLQASTKCVALGTSAILMGTAVCMGMSQESMKAVLCMIFIILTAPTAAHEISRGAHIFGVRQWEKSLVDRYEAEVDRAAHWSREIK